MFILDMIREENPVSVEASIDPYTKTDFLDEVYMAERRYENLVAVFCFAPNSLHKFSRKTLFASCVPARLSDTVLTGNHLYILISLQ